MNWIKYILVSLVFIGTFIISFLFWPEFRFQEGCSSINISPQAGCSLTREYISSDWRLHGGTTWLERQNICRMSGDECITMFNEPETYDTNRPLMFFGSLGIAGLAAYVTNLIFKKNIRKPRHKT